MALDNIVSQWGEAVARCLLIMTPSHFLHSCFLIVCVPPLQRRLYAEVVEGGAVSESESHIEQSSQGAGGENTPALNQSLNTESLQVCIALADQC